MDCFLSHRLFRRINGGGGELHDIEQDLQEEISAHIISQYRYLWLNLSEMLQALGNAYARTYSTYCLFM